MRQRTLAILTTALLAFVPTLASAHGEGVLLFPRGTACAVTAILLLAIALKLGRGKQALIVVAAIAASLPFWFVPADAYPVAMRHSDWTYFVTGLVPSLAAGALVGWACVRLHRRR